MKVTLTRAMIHQLNQFSKDYYDAHIEGIAGDLTKEEWQSRMGPDINSIPGLTFFSNGSASIDLTPPEPPQVVEAEVVKEEKPKAKSKAKKNGKGGK